MIKPKAIILILFVLALFSIFVSAQADMKIAAISFDPEKPEPGNEVTISITVVNLSAFAFEPVFKVKLYIDDIPNGEESVEGIKAKGIKTVSFKVKQEKESIRLKLSLIRGLRWRRTRSITSRSRRSLSLLPRIERNSRRRRTYLNIRILYASI